MMKRELRIGSTAMFISVVFAIGIIGSGCAHKKTREDETGNPAVETTDLGSSDTGNALGLKTVQFEYDSSTLSGNGKATLKEDAKILKNNSNVSIQIEGHCDARGGIQYNLALGERRAASVAHYLEDRGIAKSRLSTISYGKERPLVQGDTEEAYAKNRRANLVITKK